MKKSFNFGLNKIADAFEKGYGNLQTMITVFLLTIIFFIICYYLIDYKIY